VRAVFGSVVVTAAVYGGLTAQNALMGPVYDLLLGQDGLLGAPPLAMQSAVWAGPGLLVVWLACEWYAIRRQPMEARVIATATP
jgi:hypothetical protein